MAEEKALAVKKEDVTTAITKTEALAQLPFINELLGQMATLHSEISKKQEEYDELKKQVRPLVEALGGQHVTPEGVKASFSVSKYWAASQGGVKALLEWLLQKLPETAYTYFRVDPAKLSSLISSEALGPKNSVLEKLQQLGIEQKIGSKSFLLTHKKGHITSEEEQSFGAET